MRRILVPALLLALSPALTAQHVGIGHFGGSTSFRAGQFGPRAFRRGYVPTGLYNSFYDDYLSSDGYSVSAQPQVIVLQSPPLAHAEPAPPPSQPLMIELQGDRYVQVSGDPSSHPQLLDSPAKLVTRPNASPSSDASSPSVLIFRDGHREEVTGYTITDGRLYVTSNYSKTGFWIQKIELSALDVPETIAANSSHSHPFRVPSAPNEVIVGP